MKHIGGILWEAYLHALEKRVGCTGKASSVFSDPKALMEDVRREVLEYLGARGYSVGEDGRGFLTVCCICKKVRDGDDSWKNFEDYMAEHSRVEITHGLCAECVNKLLPRRKSKRGSGSRQRKAA